MTYSNILPTGSAGRRFFGRYVLAGALVFFPVVFQPAGAGQHYRETQVEHGGKVTGRIFADRATPKVERYVIPKQADICGGNHRDSPIIRVEGGALRDAVVYLEDVPAGKPFRAAAKKVTINQVGCRFVPFLSVLMDGGELEAVNSDPLLHNIHVYELFDRGRSTIASVSQPRKGDIMTMSVHLNDGRALKVECDAHDFMHAYVFVARNPYYAVIGPEGTFAIEDIPPGSYKIRAWHPYLGEREQTVEVGPESVTEIGFKY